MAASGEGLRILVAGMGNVLRRDDGFGVVVARRLLERADEPAMAGVTVLEAGIAGVRVVQELMAGYDGLVLVDAALCGGKAGTVYEISPRVGETAPESLHTVEPDQVLALARAAGCLPGRVLLVGCEPAEYDGLEMDEDLTPSVAAAVPRAIGLVMERVAAWRGVAGLAAMAEAGAAGAAGDAGAGGVLEAVRRRDELLSLMYWLRADRLNEDVAAVDLAPFAGQAAPLDDDLCELVRAGLAELSDNGDGVRYRLTRMGLEEGKRRFDEDFGGAKEAGVAGNAHEVIVGVCGPNAKCVRDGTHEDCAEPELVTAGEAGESAESAGGR